MTQLRSVYLTPDESSNTSSGPTSSIVIASRVLGNMGAPLGPFDGQDDKEFDIEEDMDGIVSNVVVYTDDPLSAGLGLETLPV